MTEEIAQQLSKIFPESEVEDWAEHLHTVSQLRISARYEHLRHLTLAHFSEAPEEEYEELAHYRLEELEPEKLPQLFEELSLKKDLVHRLFELFERLSEGLEDDQSQVQVPDQINPGGTILQFPKAVLEKVERYSRFPQSSSVELAKKLRALMDKLRSTFSLSQLSAIRIGDYWDTVIMRDLFLEEMTAREFLTIDVDALLKKRSVGPVKVQLLLEALESIIQKAQDKSMLTAQHMSAEMENAQPFVEQHAPSSAESVHQRWYELESSRLKAGTSVGALKSVFLSLEMFPQMEQVFWLDQNSYEKQESGSSLDEVRILLKNHLLSQDQRLNRQVERALQTSLVDERILFDLFEEDRSSRVISLFLSRLYLFAYEAQLFKTVDAEVSRLWIGPKGDFSQVEQVLSQASRLETQKAIELLQENFPFVDAEYILHKD